MAYKVRVRGLTRAPYRIHVEDPNTVSTTPVLVDLDDGDTRRRLQNQRARWVVLPDINTSLQKAGTVATVTTASGMVFRAPRDMTVWGVAATVGTAPTDADFIVDVHKVDAGGEATDAGTTIFTTQANRPTIAATETSSPFPGTSGAGVPDVQEVNEGDLLRVEVDQVGSGTAGSDLVVQILGY